MEVPDAVQLAERTTSDQLPRLKARGFVMEPKIDGMRIKVEKRGQQVCILSRTNKSQAGKLPHLEELFRSYGEDFTLDGEVVHVDSFKPFKLPDYQRSIPIVSFNQTMRVMGSGADKAVSGQKSNGLLYFVAFDCLYLGESLTSMPDFIRCGAMRALTDYFQTLPGGDHVLSIPRWSEWGPDWYDALIELGVEGIVLKDPKASYRIGKRSTSWLKLKETETEDVIVTGYLPGEGSFAGLIGSVTFGQYLNGKIEPRGACSGMDMPTRKMFTDRREEFVRSRQVMEVRSFGRTNADSNKSWFRHPQFIRLRDDKRPEECLWT